MRDGSTKNVLVTGTPGVGKTTFSEEIASKCGLKHLDVAKMIKDDHLFDEWDDEMGCSVFDEDSVLEALEPLLEEGGLIVDFHATSFLPPEAFELVIVLRTDNTVLYDRLKTRGYDDEKVRENVECEIFQVVLDEARETFEESGARFEELDNDDMSQYTANVDFVLSLIQQGNC